jgi:hypothetical protein
MELSDAHRRSDFGCRTTVDGIPERLCSKSERVGRLLGKWLGAVVVVLRGAKSALALL